MILDSPEDALVQLATRDITTAMVACASRAFYFEDMKVEFEEHTGCLEPLEVCSDQIHWLMM